MRTRPGVYSSAISHDDDDDDDDDVDGDDDNNYDDDYDDDCDDCDDDGRAVDPWSCFPYNCLVVQIC